MQIFYKIKTFFISLFIFLIIKINRKDYFYSFLKFYCKDLKSGIKFYNMWFKILDQYILFVGLVSCRAMSAHISFVLEGYEKYPTENKLTFYLNTKYGSQIYLNEDQYV